MNTAKVVPVAVGGDVLKGDLSPIGAPLRVATLVSVVVWIVYKRKAPSVTGAPVFAVEVHRSSGETAPDVSDVGWTRVPVLDAAAYLAGVIPADPLEVTFTGSPVDVFTRCYPGLDVSGVWWVRFLLKDQDPVNLGSVDLFVTGQDVLA